MGSKGRVVHPRRRPSRLTARRCYFPTTGTRHDVCSVPDARPEIRTNALGVLGLKGTRSRSATDSGFTADVDCDASQTF